MNEKINNLIPKAIKGISLFLAKENEETKVAKEYKGYISSLGASICQAGLLATLSFYTDKSMKRKDTDRNNVLKVIHFLIAETTLQGNADLIDYIIKNSLDGNESENQIRLSNENNPITISDLNFDKLTEFEDEIIECTTALKLALRTFEIKK